MPDFRPDQDEIDRVTATICLKDPIRFTKLVGQEGKELGEYHANEILYGLIEEPPYGLREDIQRRIEEVYSQGVWRGKTFIGSGG